MSQPSETPFYYEAAPVLTTAEREAVFAIRMTVFVEEQAVPAEEELDAYDVTAAHFLARRVDPTVSEIVGTARLLDKGHGVGKIGRVAVLREYRGQGIGGLIMRRIEHEARSAGYTELILEAQVHALPFYEKLGYIAEGDIFLDCNIEHRLMRKSL
jgi:predicted GNAT family N-acyltransferase